MFARVATEAKLKAQMYSGCASIVLFILTLFWFPVQIPMWNTGVDVRQHWHMLGTSIVTLCGGALLGSSIGKL